MQTLIKEKFIGTDIDQETQAANLLDFVWGLSIEDAYYIKLFHNCIIELETANYNENLEPKLAEQIFPYILAMQSYANTYIHKQSIKEYFEVWNEYYNKCDTKYTAEGLGKILQSNADKHQSIRSFIRNKLEQYTEGLEISAGEFEKFNSKINTKNEKTLLEKTNDLIQDFINGKQYIDFQNEEDFKQTILLLKNMYMFAQNSIYFNKVNEALESITLDQFNDNIINNHIKKIETELNKWSPNSDNLIKWSEELIKKIEEISQKENPNQENNNVNTKLKDFKSNLKKMKEDLEQVKDLTGFKKFWDNCKEFFKSFIGNDRMSSFRVLIKQQENAYLETPTQNNK
jgi:hypothetical protein